MQEFNSKIFDNEWNEVLNNIDVYRSLKEKNGRQNLLEGLSLTLPAFILLNNQICGVETYICFSYMFQAQQAVNRSNFIPSYIRY